jgi:L-fuconolactonase
MLIFQQEVEAFHVTDRLSDSERAALMGGTLERVYNWHRSEA